MRLSNLARGSALALMLGLTAGCGADDDPAVVAPAPPPPSAAAATAPVTPTLPASTTRAATPPAPANTPRAAPKIPQAPAKPPGPLRLKATSDLGDAKLTVLAYREGSASDRALDVERSEKWASIDVRICNTSSAPFEVSDDYWTLQSASGVEYDKANFQDFAMPQQPVYGDRTVRPAKCTRGWISYVVDRAEPPTLAVYSHDEDETRFAEWKLPR